ncbi:DUF3606 domain-containing protein, partial [Escherichia marmotae]|nr:DUF3606 domain-containing protein [Escherichia marmotae]
YADAEWRRIDRMSVDPQDVEQVAMLAQLLHCNRNRIDDAIAAVGPKISNIRRWLSQQSRPEPKPSRWRRR